MRAATEPPSSNVLAESDVIVRVQHLVGLIQNVELPREQRAFRVDEGVDSVGKVAANLRVVDGLIEKARPAAESCVLVESMIDQHRSRNMIHVHVIKPRLADEEVDGKPFVIGRSVRRLRERQTGLRPMLSFWYSVDSDAILRRVMATPRFVSGQFVISRLLPVARRVLSFAILALAPPAEARVAMGDRPVFRVNALVSRVSPEAGNG